MSKEFTAKYMSMTIGDLMELKKISKMNVRDGMLAIKSFMDAHDVSQREACYFMGLAESLPKFINKN